MDEVMSDQQKQDLFLGVRLDEEPVVEHWDRQVAESLASNLGVAFDDRTWEVVHFLRQYYQDLGGIEHSRDLSAMLDQRYKSKGGLRYLFTLFPGGPISQGCKIAGIPVPKDSSDPSFGYNV